MRWTIIAAVLFSSGCAANSSAPVAANNNAKGPEKRIQACIVDTIAPGGMMTVSAIHVLTSNDTMLLQANGRVPISKAVAGPRTWTNGPVQLTTTAGRVSYSPSGKPRTYAPGKIVLLGVHEKVPIFGNPVDVGAMRPEVEALAAKGVSLDKALKTRVALRRRMDKVRTLYVPTSLSNCMFQTLTRSALSQR